MSEISEVWRFLFEAVATIFNFSLDVIVGILLVVSVIPPWRWSETFEDNEHSGEWKIFCLSHFFLTILDFILLPFLFIGAFSPMRWRLLYKGLFDTNKKLYERRFTLCSVFPLACYDFLAIFVGVFTLFSPFGRQRMIVRAFSYSEPYYYDEKSTHLDELLVEAGLNSVLDVFVAVFSFLILFAPTVWWCTIKGFQEMHAYPPPNINAGEEHAWHNYYNNQRVHLGNQILHSVMDMFTFPFFLLAFFSPWRNSLIRALIWPPSSDSTRQTAEQPTTNRTAWDIIHNRVTDFEYHYRADLRGEIMYQGCLALLDYVLLPMILPLFLTYYRWAQMRDVLMPFEEEEQRSPTQNMEAGSERTTTNINSTTGRPPRRRIGAWTHKEFLLILQQFSLLITDIFFIALPLFLLFITRFRWHAVSPLLVTWKENQLFLKKNGKFYKTVLKQFGLLICDFFCLPLVAMVFLTHYRWAILHDLLTNPIVLGKGLEFHYHIVINFLIVFHDFLLFSPFLLLMGIIACYRFIYSLYLMFPNCFGKDIEEEEEATNRKTPENHEKGYGTFETTQNEGGVTTIPAETANNNNDNNNNGTTRRRVSYPYNYKDEATLRGSLWDQVIQAVFDIPILILLLFLIVSLWRCKETFTQINNYLSKENYPSNKITFNRILKRKDDDNIRIIIAEQFLLFFRDFLCLLPFTLLLITLYKLPSLLIELIAKAKMKIITGKEGNYKVTACHLKYVNGEDPVMTVRLQKKREIRGENENFTVEKERIQFKDYRLQILGKEMWEKSSQIFGGFLVNFAQSMLPLKLTDGNNLYWKDNSSHPTRSLVSEAVKAVEVAPEAKTDEKTVAEGAEEANVSPLMKNETEGDNQVEKAVVEREIITDKENKITEDEQQHLQEQWKQYLSTDEPSVPSDEFEIQILFPMKAVKNSTVVKNLAKFNNQPIKFLFQLECKQQQKKKSNTWEDAIIFQLPLTIPDITPAFESGDAYFTLSPVLLKNPTSSIEIEKTSFVNAFHAIILKAFFDLLTDFFFFALFWIVLLLNPLRFYQLLKTMVSKRSTNALIMKLLTTLNLKIHSMNYHLLEYRNSLSKFYNQIAKRNLSQAVRNQGRYYYYSFYYYSLYEETEEEDLSSDQFIKHHAMETYHYLGKSIEKDLKFINHFYKPPKLSTNPFPIDENHKHSLPRITQNDIDLKTLEEKIMKFFASHDEIMALWYQRYGIWLSLYCPQMTRSQKDLLNIVISEKHDQSIRKMLSQKMLVEDSIQKIKTILINPTPYLPDDEEGNKGKKKKKSSWKLGFMTRSTEENQKIILYYFKKAAKDLYAIALFMILILTVIRIIPLFRDYYEDQIRYSNELKSTSSSSVPFSHETESQKRKKGYSSVSTSSSFSGFTLSSCSLVSFYFHLTRQLTFLYYDLSDLGLFLFYFALICMTVVSFPAFVVDILQRNHLASISAAKKCAKYHLREFFENLCEFLLLFTAFKTYKILFKSILYILLLPAAGIAECLSYFSKSLSIFMRFSLGFILSYGVLAGAIAVIVRARTITTRATGDYHEKLYGINYSLFAVVIVTIGIILGLIFSKRKVIFMSTSRLNENNAERERIRSLEAPSDLLSDVPTQLPPQQQPQQRQSREKQFLQHSLRTIPFQCSSWNHIISSIIPFTDCLQLSAVIMYFFWTTLRSNDNSNPNSGYALNTANTHFGADDLSIVMYWTSNNDTSDSLSRKTFNTAISIAAVLGLGYIFLVTLPIAYGGESEESKRRMKIQSIRNQPFYHVLLVIVDQLLAIWMMAMFMRTASCAENTSAAGSGNGNQMVLSTAFAVECGGTDQWSSKLSIVLLIYYLISLCVLFIEDSSRTTPQTTTATINNNNNWNYDYYDNRGEKARKNEENSLVFYDTTYQILIKLYYALILVLCYVYWSLYPSYIILLFILVISLGMFCYPFLFRGFISASSSVETNNYSGRLSWMMNRLNSYCTVPSLMILKSTTFLGISWTTLICLLRCVLPNHFIDEKSVVFNTEWVIYVGWMLLFIVAIYFTVKVEKWNYENWQLTLQQQGIQEVISQLEKIFMNAFIETGAQQFTALPSDHLITNNNNTEEERQQRMKNLILSQNSSNRNISFINYFNYQLTHCVRNERDLIYLLLVLEENISVEKLDNSFYHQRNEWIRSLISLANENRSLLPRPQLNNNNNLNNRSMEDINNAQLFTEITNTGAVRQNSEELSLSYVPLTPSPLLITDSTNPLPTTEAAGSFTSVNSNLNVVPITQQHDHHHEENETEKEWRKNSTEEGIVSIREAYQVPTSAAGVQLSYGFEMILNHIAILKMSLEDTVATTMISWKILDVILDFKLPRDCCYVIHSFLIDVKEVYQFLFNEFFLYFRPIPLLYEYKKKSKKENQQESYSYNPDFVYSQPKSYKPKKYYKEMMGRTDRLYSYSDEKINKLVNVLQDKKIT
jgi:hypothetical protein